MRFLFLFFISLVSLAAYSQDLIILRNGEQINCKITKVDSAIIHYDFLKGDRRISSYIAKNEIQSYINNSIDNTLKGSNNLFQIPNEMVIIDTNKYVKETNKWINLITYSKRYGTHADGWSLQYYGFNLRSTSKWTIPLIIGYEFFIIHNDYFSKFHYHKVEMTYYSLGISPFYRLERNIYFNLGANIVFGEEELSDYSTDKNSHIFLGFSPSQGIYFIPDSKVGITIGFSAYEKILSSRILKNDIGIKIELGIKF